VMSMDFDMDAVPLAQLRDDGFSANECYPQVLVNDPTFAILNGDSYFVRNGQAPNALFANAPDANLINGRTPPFRKRSLVYPSESEFAVDTGNTTRRLTPDELDLLAQELEYEEQLAMLDEQTQEVYVDCNGDSCATEVTPVGKSTALLLSTVTAPSIVDATATAVTISLSEATAEPLGALSGGRVLLSNAPMVTAVLS